ncbi:MAG: 4Fe-4S dicluster domain-containing protein [Nitrospiraceae bacterium]|nr:4Fe-4S dicluster domain-containing protein [Nitrospiraceae bacterium]
MPEMVTLAIDEQEVEVEEGTNVLAAALGAGICIPNLCYLPGLKPTGACRVCIVEVEKNGRTKMTASCTLEAKDGMVIHAHSENVLRARRNIVELLVAEAPESEVLQVLAERIEVEDVRYPERDNDCILCGRCVTACAEIAATGAKGSIGRGMNRHIGLPFYNEEYCQKCYECRERCPMEIAPQSRRDPCGVCGSELSKNEDLIPEMCGDCELD